MSLSSQVNDLAARLATEFNSVREELSNAGASVTISETAPTGNEQTWFNSTNGVFYIRYDDAWVAISGPAGPSGTGYYAHSPYGLNVATGANTFTLDYPASINSLAYRVGDRIRGMQVGNVDARFEGVVTSIGTNPLSISMDVDVTANTSNNLNGYTFGIVGEKGATGATGPAGTTDYNNLTNKPDLTGYATKTGSETLTNKTLALGSNTVTGTTAQFNAALTDGDFVTLNGSEYPKNKTFDSTNRLYGAYFPVAGFDTNQGNFGPTGTSSPVVYIGGSTAGANFSLPSTASLNYGETLTVINVSTVPVTVKANGGTVINTLESGHVWRYVYSNATGIGVVGNWIAHQVGFTDGHLNITTNGVNDTDPLIIRSKNNHGGTGYAGIATFENTSTGASNTKKWVRMNGTGNLEIINSAYSANIFTLTDSGDLSSINNITANGNISSTNISDSGWQTVSSFANGYSGANVAYRKLNGVVYLRGRVNGGTANAGAFTLPTGYRPSVVEWVIPVQQYGTANINYVTIGTDGVVVPNGNAAWLGSVVFPVG